MLERWAPIKICIFDLVRSLLGVPQAQNCSNNHLLCVCFVFIRHFRWCRQTINLTVNMLRLLHRPHFTEASSDLNKFISEMVRRLECTSLRCFVIICHKVFKRLRHYQAKTLFCSLLISVFRIHCQKIHCLPMER